MRTVQPRLSKQRTPHLMRQVGGRVSPLVQRWTCASTNCMAFLRCSWTCFGCRITMPAQRTLLVPLIEVMDRPERDEVDGASQGIKVP